MGEVHVSLDLESPILVEGSIPEQKVTSEGLHFPYVLVASENQASLSCMLEAFVSQKEDIQNCIDKNGAVLLRGFPVLTPADFNKVLEASGYEDFPYVGRGAARTVIVGRVVTTNTSQPPHVGIGFHNEMSYQVKFPGKVIFYCNIEQPEDVPGGCTPLVQGHIVYQRLSKEMPYFLSMIESKGLIYKYPLEDGRKSHVYSWQTMFNTEDKTEGEERAAKMGIKLEWNEEDVGAAAAAVFGPRPGVQSYKGTKVWFNALDAIYEFQLYVKRTGQSLATSVTYGDGSPIADEDIEACRKIMKEEEVAFKWHKGDVLILDNMAVMHSRQTFQPPRWVLASMCV